ncbi:MAG: WecB/TagA/CpsF family glycosyltransferase [Caldilineaceae bacterium]
MKNKERQTISLLGVKIDKILVNELLGKIAQVINSGGKSTILHVNVYAMNLACELSWFRAYLNQSDIVFCDGFGVKLGAWILGHRIPQRITYADWVWQLAQFAESQNFSLFFLGARPGIAEKAAKHLQEQFPNLRVVGVQHGYFDKTLGNSENKAVIKTINALKPNILLIGFGMPIQERWLWENLDQLDINIALTGGAVFDYASGELQRGPRWMTDHGLEWLARLLIEPGRLWKRYIIGNPLFLWRVLKQWLGLASYEQESY